MTSGQYESLKSIMWDYNISEQEIVDLISGKSRNAGHYDLEKLFVKMASGLPWFSIVDILGPERIKSLLTDDVIKQIWPGSIREKYIYVRKRLHEALPDPE